MPGVSLMLLLSLHQIKPSRILLESSHLLRLNRSKDTVTLDSPVVVPLSEKHDRSTFSCGKAPLDRYLQQQAGQDRRRDLAQCFVLVYPEQPQAILGYYTLSAASIELHDLTKVQAKKLPYRVLPALLIGRLAVRQDLQGKGIGRRLLNAVLSHCFRLRNELGAYAILVDPLDQEAKLWYLKSGFFELEPPITRLFLPMAALEKILG
jgi:GNAT superfamily N-acetyltransferase